MSTAFPHGIHEPEAMCRCGHPFKVHWDVGVCDKFSECQCPDFETAGSPQ